MSLKSITPATSISEITTKTTIVALMKFAPSPGTRIFGFDPTIHSVIASSTRTPMIHSLRESGPIAASSFELQTTISGLSVTCGLQIT